MAVLRSPMSRFRFCGATLVDLSAALGALCNAHVVPPLEWRGIGVIALTPSWPGGVSSFALRDGPVAGCAAAFMAGLRGPYGRIARARTMWVYSGNIAGICTPTWANVRPDSVTPSFHHPGYWFVPG